ncbi:phage lytic cycle repressor MrpR family protein [Anaerocolumna xylanovorans]|uniref:MrpR N-terminal core-binding domain-containing protein n=1 Tax=Anaerocolumna xylanovorans DSM 12503 TaxID=1121345 RepID=A0A1M7YM15_9FIRM|nr:hypothetical protein [Anaerocolumna xylanovorans]SHO53674.1 hypothetical protein SAMN02745217_04229 [Anaerocolumna xylanovorans DSM 12503]
MFDIVEGRKRKESYLSDPFCKYDVNTKPIIRRYFISVEKIEAQFEKDLCNFTMDEVVKLLKSFNSRSRKTLFLILSYFTNYYQWCLKEGLVESNNIINFYDRKIMEPFIAEIVPLEFLESKFITRETLYKYIDMFDDYSLKFISYAIFMSVLGNEFEELSNLKMDDLNETEHTVKLITGRIVKVDDLFIKLMKKANEEHYYHPQGLEQIKRLDKKYYDESCYVFKVCSTGAKDLPASDVVLGKRLRDAQKVIKNRWFNGTNIYRSGLINYIKSKFAERGITFKQALYNKVNRRDYEFESEIQNYIYEFGSNMTTRMFRLQIKDILELIE